MSYPRLGFARNYHPYDRVQNRDPDHDGRSWSHDTGDLHHILAQSLDTARSPGRAPPLDAAPLFDFLGFVLSLDVLGVVPSPLEDPCLLGAALLMTRLVPLGELASLEYWCLP